LLISIIIARLLGPDAFGTYAVALVALAAVLSFNELGISLAIVRWEGDPRHIAPTVTTISTAASLVFFGVAYALTPAFATAMGDPSATDVVRLMLVCVPLNGLVATPAALLQREFQQGRRAIADQVNIWLGALISVVLAFLGWGAMSLAIGRVVATVVFSVMLVAFCPKGIRFGWNRDVVGPLLRFGLPLAGSSVIVFAVGYADQMVVGTVLGTQALGFYLLAFNLASWPVSMLSQPVRAVAPAAFARIQSDDSLMDRTFRAAFRLLTAVAIPACCFIAGAAVPIITFVYGEQWAPAALALQWLALQAVVRILFELSYDFLAVKRRTRALLFVQGIWLAVLIPSLLLGARLGGVGGVALAQFLVALVVLICCYSFALDRAGIQLAPLGRAAAVPVLGGAVAVAGSMLVARMISSNLLAAFTAGVFSLAVIGVLVLLSRGFITVFREARTAAPAQEAV
jgi:PST family polysaccharide transporter